jgi:hypothetical protein
MVVAGRRNDGADIGPVLEEPLEVRRQGARVHRGGDDGPHALGRQAWTCADCRTASFAASTSRKPRPRSCAAKDRPAATPDMKSRSLSRAKTISRVRSGGVAQSASVGSKGGRTTGSVRPCAAAREAAVSRPARATRKRFAARRLGMGSSHGKVMRAMVPGAPSR